MGGESARVLTTIGPGSGASPGGHCIVGRLRAAIPSAPATGSVIVRSQVKPAVVRDHSEEEPRRARTDAASVSRADVVISMSMQASVTDWP